MSAFKIFFLQKIYLAFINKFKNQSFSDPIVCKAPFRSIFFDFHGNAYPCCENKTYSYGKYPNQSIHEIWFGEKINKFRLLIKKRNLDHGCVSCKPALTPGNGQITKSTYYECVPGTEKYPSRIEFQLSNQCNLECFMCDSYSSSVIRGKIGLKQYHNPYDDSFVEQLEEFIPFLKQTHFVGGEPFMIPVFFKIWEKIISLNPQCEIIVQTNATVFNENIKSLLERGRFSFNISIDSLKKDMYERIRKNARFEDTMAHIYYFIDYCRRKKTDLKLTACPMQQNWTEIPDLIRFSNKNDIKIHFHTVLFPARVSFFGCTREELNNIYIKLSEVKINSQTITAQYNLKSFNHLLYQLKHFYTNYDIKEKFKHKDLV
jgi:MoaA/NifB/PqqE/SkfB family radical SAM enzyme